MTTETSQEGLDTPWMKPFTRTGEVTYGEGLSWPNGERIFPGASLHHRNFGGDPFLLLPEDGDRTNCDLWWQHPVSMWDRWPTSIWHAKCDITKDTVTTDPKPVQGLQPLESEGRNSWQYETVGVTRANGLLIGGSMRYEYRPTWDRPSDLVVGIFTDPITFKPHGLITPTEPWEKPFKHPKSGKLQGGCAEGTYHVLGSLLVCVYQGLTYANGQKPNIGLAISMDAKTWIKWPQPIYRHESGPSGAGQPDSVMDPKGRGLHLFWQTSQFINGVKMHYFHHGFMFAGNFAVVQNPSNPILTQTSDPNDPDGFRITAPSCQPHMSLDDGSIQWDMVYFGADKPARSGGKNIIMHAVSEGR